MVNIVDWLTFIELNKYDLFSAVEGTVIDISTFFEDRSKLTKVCITTDTTNKHSNGADKLVHFQLPFNLDTGNVLITTV